MWNFTGFYDYHWNTPRLGLGMNKQSEASVWRIPTDSDLAENTRLWPPWVSGIWLNSDDQPWISRRSRLEWRRTLGLVKNSRIRRSSKTILPLIQFFNAMVSSFPQFFFFPFLFFYFNSSINAMGDLLNSPMPLIHFFNFPPFSASSIR